MIPGGGEEEVPPPPTGGLDAINSRLDALENVAADLERSLTVHLGERLAALGETADGMANQLQGYVASRHAALGATAEKIATKLQKNLNKQLGQVYTYAFPYGITYPTNEQALYGLQTGDVLGSFGLAAPGVPLPPDAIVPPVPIDGGPVPVVQIPPVSVSGGTGSDALPNPFPVGAPPIQPGAVSFPPQPILTGPPTSLPPGPAITPNPIPPVPITNAPPAGSPPPAPPPPAVQPSTITGQGQCPAGTTYQPPGSASYGVYTVGLDPNPVVAGRGARRTPQPLACQPAFGNAATATFEPPTAGPVSGSRRGRPWLTQNPASGEPFSILACVNGCHLAQPTAGQVRVYVPVGTLLYADGGGGLLWWSDVPLDPPWAAVPTEVCDDTQPSATPPGGVQPPAPAGGGGTCVPTPGGPGTCPVFPVPACGAPTLGAVPQMGLGDSEFCDAIDAFTKAYEAGAVQLADWIGMASDSGELGTVGSAIARAVVGTDVPILPALLKRAAGYLQKVILQLAGGLNCDPVKMAPVVIYRAVAELINKYTGVVPDQLLTVINQVSHTVCQSLLPDVGQADHAYLAAGIAEDVWTCWVKAHGHHVAEAKAVRDSKRHKPSVPMAVKLAWRNLIGPDRFNTLMRQNGVINADDASDLLHAEKAFPSLGEGYRWAGEQLFDEGVAQRFGLDEGWDAVQQTRFMDVVNGHGLEPSWAKFEWRAHWRRPMIHELIEMVRRLRPDKVNENLVFTQDDLNAALLQEGFNSYWATRIQEIAYKVPTRRDVQRLYDYHQIDETEMKSELQTMGYDSDYADLLVSSWETQRQISEARFNGKPMPSRLVGDYAKGLLSRSELQEQAQAVSYYPGQSEEIEQAAVNARNVEERKLAVSGLKGLFMKGLISVEDATAQLTAKGIDPDAAQELTGYWVRVKNSRPKQVAAGTLCQWRKDGLINATEQYGALVRLGYGGTDAEFIVKDCTLKIQQANAAAEQKALKAAQAAAEKAAKEAARAARNATRRVKVVSQPAQPPA